MTSVSFAPIFLVWHSSSDLTGASPGVGVPLHFIKKCYMFFFIVEECMKEKEAGPYMVLPYINRKRRLPEKNEKNTFMDLPNNYDYFFNN